ncbi:MAG: hypothetical protein AB7I79_09290 [Rhizobiaceae bacterium]
MSDEKQIHVLDDPEKKPRIVRALVWMTPAIFALCYFLAWIQGAGPRHCLLIAGVGAGMCASAALVIHVMGSKSWMALVALKVALLLVGKR